MKNVLSSFSCGLKSQGNFTFGLKITWRKEYSFPWPSVLAVPEKTDTSPLSTLAVWLYLEVVQWFLLVLLLKIQMSPQEGLAQFYSRQNVPTLSLDTRLSPKAHTYMFNSLQTCFATPESPVPQS